jgi:kynurenine formamidase
VTVTAGDPTARKEPTMSHPPVTPVTDDDRIAAIFEASKNWGRWGDDDGKGTLNLITPAKRVQAARLVRTGRSLSLAQPLSKHPSVKNPRPITHLTAFEAHHPRAMIDYFGMVPHGFSVTHLDAIGHVFFEDTLYNGHAAEDVCSKSDGLLACSIYAQREGIFTRGVLLDVAAARGRDWLPPDAYVTVADLEAAEAHGGVEVSPGDALLVRVGREAWEQAQGVGDQGQRAGLDAGAVGWLRERDVAVFGGDCIERMPYPSERFPVPLHQIGCVAMGLVLLDTPLVEELARHCADQDRFEFLLTCAPLPIPGGTGSPVNPLAVF